MGMYFESQPIIRNVESVTNTIPRATINSPDIIETILRCLLSFLRSLEKKLINMLASIKGSPRPAVDGAGAVVQVWPLDARNLPGVVRFWTSHNIGRCGALPSQRRRV